MSALNRLQITWRAAQDIEDGQVVNLGIGLPVHCSDYLRPEVDVILIEVPDEVGGYGAKGVGEIGCVATAGAVASALHSYDGIRRFRLPMQDAPAAAPSVPKSRRKV